MAREGNKNKDHKLTRAKREDHDKRFLMATGVCFFMVLIVILWIFNLRADLGEMSREARQSGDDLENFFKENDINWKRFENIK